METDPSIGGFEDGSAEGLGEALVDSDKAGQESASIAVGTSTSPLEGLFQAGFLGLVALPLLPLELSAAAELLGGGEEEEEEGAAFEGEQSEKGSCSGTDVASDDKDEDDEGGDWLTPGIASASPRTTWAHADGRLLRLNWGLSAPSPSPPENT